MFILALVYVRNVLTHLCVLLPICEQKKINLSGINEIGKIGQVSVGCSYYNLIYKNALKSDMSVDSDSG